jgi:hypothetical protein
VANPTFSGDAMFNIGLASISLRTQSVTIDATWPQRNFAGYNNITYTIIGPLTVASGATLTIPAGTVIKSMSGCYLDVNGSLRVNGAAGNRVVFTSTRDDSYGNPMDTNQDGATTTPHSGDWGGVYFRDISVDANSYVNYAQLNYSNDGLYWETAAAPCAETNFFGNRWGVNLAGASSPTITNFNISGSQFAPIIMSLASNPTFVGGTLTNNAYQALEIIGETTSADYTIPRRDVGGDNNIVYLIRGTDLTVGSNSVLTIQPGVVIKVCPYRSIIVNKGLMAVSNSSDPDSQIVFTSYRDDFYGGDTNNDGDASVPVPDDWRRISFEDVSIDPLCHLKNCVFRYGYASYDYGLVTTTNASPMIEHCLFADANTGIRANGASNPVIHNCDLVRLTGYGVNNVGASFVINAENNWWGSNTGPTHSGNPGGTGVPVSDNVDYQPFLTNNSNNPRLGDVSLNSTITAYDAALILLWIVDPVGNPLNALQLQVADVTGAGGVTSLDASYILQYVVGIIDVFPAELTSVARPGEPTPRDLDAPNAVLSLGDVRVLAGEEVLLPLSASSDGEILSGYAEMMLPAGCEFVEIVPAGGKQAGAAMRDGMLRVAFASARPVTAGQAVAFIRLRADGESPTGAAREVQWRQATVNENAAASGSGGKITVIAVPHQYALLQNYPNPFNPNTTIPFELAEAGHVQMIVYDLLGRQVAELENGDFTAGRHVARWNGQNAAGENVASGVYVVRLNAGHFEAVRKLQLVR